MRRTLLFAGVSVVFLLGGLYLAITDPFETPAVAWLEAYPLPALGFTLVAGFADGLNPCAITTLLLFLGALLAIVEHATRQGELRESRLRIWTVAGAYILGIFLLYLLLGVGFLQVSQLRLLGNGHLATHLVGFVAVVLGLIMIAEYLYPESPVRLTMPAALHGVAHRWGRRTTTGAAFVGGVLIGTCTIPCGGAMYLAIAGLIGHLSSPGYAYSLLTGYNVAFVFPLVLLVLLASRRSLLRRFTRLHVAHRARIKLVLGLFVVLTGLFALL